MESGDQTTGRENNEEGNSGQLEHVCGQPSDQLWGRFNEETWWTLMKYHLYSFILCNCGEFGYSGSGVWGLYKVSEVMFSPSITLHMNIHTFIATSTQTY